MPNLPPRVRVCRGCCCGTRSKHPDVDHESIAAALSGDELGGAAQTVTTDCLWACDLSNVVVVNPSPAGRSRGARPAWVAEVNSVERARIVAAWVRAGGPGLADPPAGLDVRTAAGLRRLTPDP